MKIDVVRPQELGPHELSLWLQIQAGQAELSSPFLTPQFAAAVARARPGTRVAVMSNADGVLGFLAFERGRSGIGQALAKGLSDIQGLVAPLTADIDLSEVLGACGMRLWEFDHLLAAQEKWFMGAPRRTLADSSPVIEVRDTWETYEHSQRAVSNSVFQSTARKLRKLERDRGTVRLVFHEPDHATLDHVLRWKSDQYRRTGRRDRFADREIRGLVHDMLDVQEPTFGVALSTLRAGDELVAAHLGLRSTGTLAWWFPVYGPRYGAYSPGLILCIGLARAMRGEGLSVLDLGKGDERYKRRLANCEIALLGGSVARNELILRIDAARRWPQRRLTRTVLQSPRLRRLARSTLNHVGTARQRVARWRE